MNNETPQVFSEDMYGLRHDPGPVLDQDDEDFRAFRAWGERVEPTAPDDAYPKFWWEAEPVPVMEPLPGPEDPAARPAPAPLPPRGAPETAPLPTRVPPAGPGGHRAFPDQPL